MKHKVELVIDLGNSQTRAVARAGFKDGKDLPSAIKTFVLTNDFVTIEDDYELEEVLESDDYTSENSFVIKNFNLAEDYDDYIYISGLIAERNYSRNLTKPTSTLVKYDNKLIYLAIAKTVNKTIQWVSGFTKGSGGNVWDLISLDLVLLAPPLQVRLGEKEFQRRLNEGISYLDYFSKSTVNIEVNSVTVMPEGLASYFATVFSYSNANIRPDYAELQKKQVLVFDVGAGTTDVIAVDHGKIVETSKTTIRLGGNNIISKVRTKFNTRTSTDLQLKAFEDVMIDPVVKIGTKEYNVKNIVDSSKREVGQQIVNDLQSFFEAQNIDLKRFERLLVVGGGAISNGTSRPLSELIYEGVREFIPEIQLVNTGNIKEDLLEEVGLDFTSLRNLNLLGALTVTELKRIKSVSSSIR